MPKMWSGRLLHFRTLTRGDGNNECGDNGVDSDAPVPAGRIYDIFAEFEKEKARRKQKMAAATPALQHALSHLQLVRGSIGRPRMWSSLRFPWSRCEGSDWEGGGH